MANIRSSRKSGFIQRSGVRRRESLWVGFAGSDVAMAAASTAVLLTSLNAAALALRPFTVVRTRGVLQIRSDQEAADEVQDVAYGHAVVSDQASAIGITAVPTPVTDDVSDMWFVYQRIMNSFRFASGVGFDGGSGRFLEFDSKAMRKVEDGQDMISASETSAFSGGAVLSNHFRYLLKLH